MDIVWQPIAEYPELEPGQKGPTVLMCQADTDTWGEGWAFWPILESGPRLVVRSRPCRVTHFAYVTMPSLEAQGFMREAL